MATNRSNSQSHGRGRVAQPHSSPITTPPHGFPNQQSPVHQLVPNGTHTLPSVPDLPPYDIEVESIQFFNKIAARERWFVTQLSKQQDVIATQGSLLGTANLQLRSQEIEKNEAVRLEADKDAELATLRTELEHANEEKSNLIQVQTDIEAELKECKSNVEALNEENDILTQAKIDVEAELEASKSEAAELNEKVEAAEEAALAENGRLKDELEAAKEATDQMEKKLKDLKMDMNVAIVAKGKAEKEALDLKAEITALECLEEESESKRRSLQGQLEQSQKSHKATVSDLLTNEIKLEKANERGDSLQKDLSTSGADRDRYKKELDECKANNSKLTKQLNTAQAELRTHREDLADVKENNHTLQSDNKGQKSTINRLEEELRKKEGQKKAFDAQKTAAEASTANLQEQLQKAAAEKSLVVRQLKVACEKDEKHFQQVTSFLFQKVESLKAERGVLRVAVRVYKVLYANRQDHINSIRRAAAPRQSQPPQKHETPAPAPSHSASALQLLSPVSVTSNDMKEDQTEDGSLSSFKNELQAFSKDNEVQGVNKELESTGHPASDGKSYFRTASKDEFQKLATEGLNSHQGRSENATLPEIIAKEQAATSMSDNATGSNRTLHPLPNPPHRPSASPNSSQQESKSTPETAVSTGSNNSRTKGNAVNSKPTQSEGPVKRQNQLISVVKKRRGSVLDKQPPKGPRLQDDRYRPSEGFSGTPYARRG